MHSDEDLLKALRRRDPEAFTVLFEIYSDKIYRLSVGILKNEDEAEGVVQETFLKLFHRLDHFEGRSKLGTWLYRVAYNASIDRVRQRRPEVSAELLNGDGELPAPKVLVDWSQWPEKLLTEAEVSQELDKAIAALPEKLRAIFILREVEDLSTREAAQIAGLSEGAVKVRLHRARLLLRERLAESLAAYGGELAGEKR